MLLDECEELFGTRDLYAALQIDNRTASYAELKKAYYRQSMIWHPDKETDEALKDIATRRFQMISRCYEVLSDKDKRAFYDRTGSVDEDNTLSKEDAYNLLRTVLINVSPEDFKTFYEEYREKHSDENDCLLEDGQTGRDEEMSLASADDQPTNDKPEPLCQTITNEEGRFIVTVDVKVEERGDAPLRDPNLPEGFNTDDMSIMQIYVETIEAIPVRSNAEEAIPSAEVADLSGHDMDSIVDLSRDELDDYEAAADIDDSFYDGDDCVEGMDSGNESGDSMECESGNSTDSEPSTVRENAPPGQPLFDVDYSSRAHSSLEIGPRELDDDDDDDDRQFHRRVAELNKTIMHQSSFLKNRNFAKQRCPHCQKSFTTPQVLYRHILIHIEERQHKCDQCNASFNRQCKLKVHRKLHNSNKAT